MAIPLDPIENKIFQKAEPLVKEIFMEEVRAAIRILKNWKAPGSDTIPSELIKYGEDDMYNFIYRICLRVWQEEKMPENWNEEIIIPLHKKGNKTECNNYREISLLNSVYKIFSKVLLNRLIPYAEDQEYLGEYQCGFHKGRSTIEQLSVIAQIIEKKHEYRQDMRQMFVDFRKAYDSIHRNSLYNIMEEFRFLKKLINLTKLAMEGVKYQVRVDNIMLEVFNVETGLKQGDALSSLLFNIALEKAVRVLQNEARGLNVDEHQIKVLGFADDLNILGDSLDDTVRATDILECAVERIGLNINTDKTKLLELLSREILLDVMKTISYEKVEEFQYLGILLSTKNDWSREIGSRITKAERAFFTLLKFFKSKLFSKRTKTRLYTSIIKPILTYGCEVWTTTSVTQRRLRTFENKVWRRICGPIRSEDRLMAQEV
jgi:sorting nexin-29